MASDWLERTRDLPTDPGVYLMKDRAGEIIYVGKAKNLRTRVRSYFQDGTSDYRAFVSLLSEILGDIETLIVRSEKEALILERELIRQHEPRFNVIWKDDKQYLCLKIDPSHEFPWVQVVRQMGKDGAHYFGPFHSATAARQTLRVVNRYFQLRTCRDSVLYNRSRPCLEYQIGRCPAPCVFEIDRDAYRQDVQDVTMFLEGKRRALVDKLEARMWAHAEELEYELAARTRNQISAIRKTLEPQSAVLPSMRDQDVIGLYSEGTQFTVSVIAVRKGRVKTIDKYHFEEQASDENDMLESFLLLFYNAREDMPEEVLLTREIDAADALSELLSEKRGRKVSIKTPKRGERAKVLELALQNAEHAFLERRRRSGSTKKVLDELVERLRLSRRPERIECYDISNFQGREVVGSQVTFVRALPDKSQYRRYRVRNNDGQDDFAAMYEVLSRRLSRGKKEGVLPDLIVIDGGKGQLNVVRAALSDLGIEGIDLVSLAKSRVTGRDSNDRASRSPERVFLPGYKDPIILRQSSAALLLLARIRDEAHRFAITFHKSLRRKRTLSSELEEIPGVGPKRRKALLAALGSVKRIKEASLEDLAAVPGLGSDVAARVFRFFREPA